MTEYAEDMISQVEETSRNLVINSPVYDDYAKYVFTWPWCFKHDISHSYDFSLVTDWTPDQVWQAYADEGFDIEFVFANESCTKAGESEYGTIIYDINPGSENAMRANLYYNTSKGNGSLYFRLFSKWDVDLREHRAWLASLMPLPPVPEEKIQVKFTYSSGGDVQEKTRNIEACEWPEIKGNYSASSVNELESLVNLTPEDMHGGKLALLYGPPGTGKTHLIRALARNWKSWANISYIIDVDRFFDSASYMIDVLLSDDDEKWKVIICEDAEEYIAPDSKNKVGQALSRLLNVGDGLLGQGLKIMFIFTTNARAATLHPAITRSGRCFAKVEIPLLTRAEAEQWLEGAADPPWNGGKGISLADLYELKSTTTKIEHAEEEVVSIGQFL